MSGPTKRRGGRRHGHVDHGAALLEQTHQRDRLVGGDAAGDADDDASAGERSRALGHRSTLRVAGTLAVARRLPRVADAAQGQVRLDGVDARHLAQPRLVGIAAGGDDGHPAIGGGALEQLAAQGGEQAAHQADVAEHRTGLHGVHGVGADRRWRPPQLDARQLAGAADERLEAEPHARRDRAADVGAIGIHQVEVGARSEVDHDGRAAELDARRQGVGEPVGARLGRPVDVDRERALERGGVDDRRLDADPLRDEALPGLGQRRHDAGERHGVELVEAVGVERQQAGEHGGDLVGRRVCPRDGAPRARQPVVLEEADRDVRVADVGRQQLHGPYRSSRSCENGHAVVRC